MTENPSEVRGAITSTFKLYTPPISNILNMSFGAWGAHSEGLSRDKPCAGPAGPGGSSPVLTHSQTNWAQWADEAPEANNGQGQVPAPGTKLGDSGGWRLDQAKAEAMSPPAPGPQRSATPSGRESSSRTSPISMSTSPDGALRWQVSDKINDASDQINVAGVGSDQCRDEVADYLQEIDALKKQLQKESKFRKNAEAALAAVANNHLLEHCKGLEQKLARQQKKAKALEAINQSLRQQLARQPSSLSSAQVGGSRCAGLRAVLGGDDSSVLGSVLESVECCDGVDNTHYRNILASSADEATASMPSGASRMETTDHSCTSAASAHSHIRTWSRFSSSGVLSPCKKDPARGNAATPVRAAQVWLERVLSCKQPSTFA